MQLTIDGIESVIRVEKPYGGRASHEKADYYCLGTVGACHGRGAGQLRRLGRRGCDLAILGGGTRCVVGKANFEP
jgi:hypothetical protein